MQAISKDLHSNLCVRVLCGLGPKGHRSKNLKSDFGDC